MNNKEIVINMVIGTILAGASALGSAMAGVKMMNVAKAIDESKQAAKQAANIIK